MVGKPGEFCGLQYHQERDLEGQRARIVLCSSSKGTTSDTTQKGIWIWTRSKKWGVALSGGHPCLLCFLTNQASSGRHWRRKVELYLCKEVWMGKQVGLGRRLRAEPHYEPKKVSVAHEHKCLAWTYLLRGLCCWARLALALQLPRVSLHITVDTEMCPSRASTTSILGPFHNYTYQSYPQIIFSSLCCPQSFLLFIQIPTLLS